MTEFIIRLTDAEVDLLRDDATQFSMARLNLIAAMLRQVRDALALYDQLVAETEAKQLIVEAEAASDD